MSEWKETTLTDLCTEISYGYTESAKQEKVGPKFLRITDIASGRLDWANVPYCPITDSNFDKYKLLPGDIVIARTGATTGANYTIKETDPKDVVFASYLIRYKINIKKANPYFIGQILQSSNWKDYVDAIAGGSAQPGANAKQLGSFDILLPPLPEQTAIASILSSLDGKIDLLHRQNTTLEKMAETLFRQWFVEEAKEEWEEGKLSCLVESANTGLDAIRRAPIVDNYTGIKCLRIQDISQSKPIVNWGNTAVSESDYRKAQLKKGDIIMARTCSPGILLHIQEDLPAVFNNGLARIRANKENCHPLFLKYLFKTDLFINHIYGISDGTAVQLNMKLGDLLSFELNIPPKEVLETFIEIIKKWDDKILINQTQIHTLTSMRDTLLPKLMSGEVRVEY